MAASSRSFFARRPPTSRKARSDAISSVSRRRRATTASTDIAASGPRADQRDEVAALEGDDVRFRERGGAGGARAAVKQGEVAEELANAKHCEREVGSLRAGHIDADGALGDDEERLAGVVLLEDDVAAAVAATGSAARQRLAVGIGQRRQKRHTLEEVGSRRDCHREYRKVASRLPQTGLGGHSR